MFKDGDEIKQMLSTLSGTLYYKDAVKLANSSYSVHELLIPFVNLSIPNNNKPVLGETTLIESCFQVLKLGDNETNYYISSNLEEAKQNAAKVLPHAFEKKIIPFFLQILWNLSFDKSVCKKIKEKGLGTLQSISASPTISPMLKKNIDGILFMLKEEPATPT